MKLISSFQERFAEAAGEINVTQLADKLGISKQSVSAYLNGTRRPKQLTVSAIAQILRVDPAWLMGYDVEKYPPELSNQTALDALVSQHPEIFRPKMRKVPLLGKVACGQPIYSPNFDDGFALINDDIPADFALVAKGDSMTGVGIHDGDVVFFREQDMVDNGQIAAVFVDDEVTLKRVVYYREKNKLILYSENPAFEPLVYLGEELDHIHIIGRAIAQLRKL